MAVSNSKVLPGESESPWRSVGKTGWSGSKVEQEDCCGPNHSWLWLKLNTKGGCLHNVHHVIVKSQNTHFE